MPGYQNKALLTSRLGTKFNSLTAEKFIGYAPHSTKQLWLCKCDCGGTRVVRWHNFIRGWPKTCGCRHGSTKHTYAVNARTGLKREAIYTSWVNMRQRCNNPNKPDYKFYGARGIKVCDRWQNSFQNFLDDMGEAYYAHKKTHTSTTLDRTDVNGDYSPQNCSWADRKVQSGNRRPWLQKGKLVHSS